MDFVNSELDIIKFWDDNDLFNTSLKLSEDKPRYVFYDGPPFATGLPHYGHILASTLKDIIPRYKTQNGFYVERRWGTDCHGLPIEYEIEKLLGIKTKQDVLKYGICNYNEECRKIVFRYKKEWETTINRLGRWVDFKNDYKTLDKNFMESVWNVFSELYKKKLIYKGSKIMPYSTGCNTPLSNFEANSNYQKVLDSSLVVKFKIKNNQLILKDIDNIYLLVWTTTPWTLPTNLALCINENLKYIVINYDDEYYILNDESLHRYFNKKKCSYTIIKEIDISIMKNIEYIPLFDYYNYYENAFKIYCDNYVSSSSGTGIVHLSPAFGEDDNRICKKYNIISNKKSPPCPLDENGIFTSEIIDYQGIYIKDSDKIIVEDLKTKKLVFEFSKKYHDYPFCWRSNTPLIYKSVSCWFVEVTKLKDDITKNNNKINWSPDWVGKKRFGNWLENLSDWCISRNRYWGTPIPIWSSDDGEEIIVIGSIEELETLANLEKGSIKDLHRHHIDKITIPSKMGKGDLHRIEEVLDCWFESGSMPFAQNHYPFTISKEEFIKKHFPADFIAEGLDQTRGWFYTLLVLSTALFNEAPFKNVIVNGLVLADDGQKMSKSKKNYTQPEDIINKYGADALRLSLINSPVVKAEEMKFRDSDVENIIKNIHIPLKNTIVFLKQMINLYEKQNNELYVSKKIDIHYNKNKLSLIDNWMIQMTNTFIKDIHNEIENYKLFKIVNICLNYLDILSKWYININKNRIKEGIYNNEFLNSLIPLDVISNALYYYSVMTAPFTPFICETIFQEMKPIFKMKDLSVHLIQMPKNDLYETNTLENNIVRDMNTAIKIINLGRKLRSREQISFKKPIKEIIIMSPDIESISDEVIEIIYNEMNVIKINKNNDNKYMKKVLTPNYKKTGHLLGNKMKQFKIYLENLNNNEIEEILKQNYVDFNGVHINKDLLEIKIEYVNIENKYIYDSEDNILLLFDKDTNDNIDYIYNSKILLRELQNLRKKFNLKQYEKINFYYEIIDEGIITDIIKNKQKEYIFPFLKNYLIEKCNEKKMNNSKILSINDIKIKIFLE